MNIWERCLGFGQSLDNQLVHRRGCVSARALDVAFGAKTPTPGTLERDT